MLGLWRSHSLPAATSSLLWRRSYATSGHKLVANTGSHDSVSAPVKAMLRPEVTSDLDMRNTRQAYASKTSLEIVRGYFVFTLCSYEFLIKHQKQLLNLVRRMLGRHLFRHVMRMTVFGQFMAGETTEEILKVARHYHDHGVSPMFAYTTKEKHGSAKDMVGAEGSDELININHEAMQKCIELTKISPKLPNEYLKTTGKLTALGSADTFRSTTTLIRANNKLLKVALEEAGTSGSWRQIADAIKQLVTSQGEDGVSHVAMVTGFPLPTNFQTLDWRSLTTCQAFHLAVSRSTKIANLLKEVDNGSAYCCPLSAETENALLAIWRRMDDLSQRSADAGVCLVVDAEQTYLQDSMDLMTLDLMRKYNTGRPMVHNTYQCYLTRTYDVIVRDMTSADAEGFFLGAKIVRGAYLDEERSLAQKLGYPDPVTPTFEETTAMYYKVAEELLRRSARGATVQVTFATHNEETVKHIVALMKAHEITPDRNVFAFAQLIGMRDHIAFILGGARMPVNKLLHYGDVEGCVAYLSRRITENQSGVPSARVERNMLGAELRRRMRTGEFFRWK